MSFFSVESERVVLVAEASLLYHSVVDQESLSSLYNSFKHQRSIQ